MALLDSAAEIELHTYWEQIETHHYAVWNNGDVVATTDTEDKADLIVGALRHAEFIGYDFPEQIGHG